MAGSGKGVFHNTPVSVSGVSQDTVFRYYRTGMDSRGFLEHSTSNISDSGRNTVTLAQLGTFALSHSNGTKIRFQGPYQTNRLNLRYNLRTHHRVRVPAVWGKNDLESGIHAGDLRC